MISSRLLSFAHSHASLNSARVETRVSATSTSPTATHTLVVGLSWSLHSRSHPLPMYLLELPDEVLVHVLYQLVFLEIAQLQPVSPKLLMHFLLPSASLMTKTPRYASV
jgi:hypothetical protein